MLSRVTPRVLSIQSTVSYGYVGNKAATFPLQCLGFNVDGINTVSLSNHPNYKNGFKGQFLNVEEMRSTIQGLGANDLLNHDVIISGYTRDLDLLREIKETVAKVKASNPHSIYVCDPVLGDNGEYYVPKDLLETYKTSLIPMADVITPNYFEVEVLTGMKVRTLEEASTAASKLHDLGAPVVIMTGQRLSGDGGPQSIILSTRFESDDRNSIFRLDVPTLPSYFFGCGDLFTALTANGVYRALCMTGISLSAIPHDHTKKVLLRHYLGFSLEINAWAMSKVVASTYESGQTELRIVENIHAYCKVRDDWMNKNKDEGIGGKNLYIHNEIYEEITTAYCTTHKVKGIICDMDGTMTMPGLIDFDAMYHRNNLSREQGGDILALIAAMPDESSRAKALAIVEEEEMKGMERCEIRHDLIEFLRRIKINRIRIALSTRNSKMALDHFYKKSGLPSHVFHPALHRDSLNGVNKPSPEVAHYVFRKWGTFAAASAEGSGTDQNEEGCVDGDSDGDMWFIGDSIDDMKCGYHAGCKTCLIRTGKNEKLEKDSGFVTIAVDSLTEWTDYVGIV